MPDLPSSNALFGELRSLAHERASTYAWSTICQNLNKWSDQEAADVAIPYLSHHLSDWDEAIKITPALWLERLIRHDEEPRLSLCRVLKIDARAQARLDMHELVHHEALSSMTALDLSGCTLRPEVLQALCEATALRDIRGLNLQAARGVNFPDMERLINASWVEGLERLNLADTSLRDDGFEVFVHAPGLAGLKTLSCQATHLSAVAFERVPHAVWCEGIEDLDLSLCHVNAPESLTRMLENEQMSSLRKLDLRGVGITPQVIVAWRECEHFTALRELCVSEHRELGTSALALLCKAPWVQHLDRFELGDMRFDDMHVQLVLTSLGQAAITQLVLDENRITDLGAKFIEQSLVFPRLELLDISYNQITPGGIQLLESSPRARGDLQVKWWQS